MKHVVTKPCARRMFEEVETRHKSLLYLALCVAGGGAQPAFEDGTDDVHKPGQLPLYELYLLLTLPVPCIRDTAVVTL